MKFSFPALASYWTQIMAAIVVNMLSLCLGITFSWLSPILVLLQSPDSPFDSDLTVDEASWLGSVYSFGAIPGYVLFGMLANKLGRKPSLLLIGLPIMLCWLLILFSTNVYYLYAARILLGLTGGGVLVCVPIFGSEISEPKIRGRLGSLLFLFINLGFLTGIIIGAYAPYYIAPKVLISLSVTIVIAITFFYETPHFLIISGKDQEAIKSLSFYRNLKTDVEDDRQQIDQIFNEINDNITKSSGLNKFSFQNLKNMQNVKKLLQASGVVCLYALCGIFPLVIYATKMFKQLRSPLDPNIVSILMLGSLTLGNYLNTFIADRFARKSLVIASLSGTAICFMCAGIFINLRPIYHLQSWIIALNFCLAMFISGIGLVPLSFVIMCELIPQNIRDFGASFCNVIFSTSSFCILKLVPHLMFAAGVESVVFMFCGFCIVGLLFVIFFVPETKPVLV